jgi:GR25 family glycosyltransferase involved in LPS biosynthesis
MKAYLINLDRAQDRRDYMLGELERLAPNLQVERALSVDIRDPDWAPPADWTPGRWRSDRWSLPPSDIEIFRSHMDGWKKIAEDGKPGLVLEDDLLFSETFPQALDTLMAAAPSGIIRLDGVRTRLLMEKPQPLSANLSISCMRSVAPSCAAYFIDPRTAAALVAAARIDRHVDDYLFDPVRANHAHGGHGIDAYQLEPVICLQAQFGGFAAPDRVVPAFLKQTKRVDNTRRRDQRYVGPLVFRVWKEVLRFRKKQMLKRLGREVIASGGRLADAIISRDLTWG